MRPLKQGNGYPFDCYQTSITILKAQMFATNSDLLGRKARGARDKTPSLLSGETFLPAHNDARACVPLLSHELLPGMVEVITIKRSAPSPSIIIDSIAHSL